MAEIITRKLESAPVIEATLSNATYKGDKGDPGEKGSDGYTPIKGTDYFTPAEIAQITANATPDLTNYATKTYVDDAVAAGGGSGASTAANVSFDDTIAATGATNVQGAIDEVVGRVKTLETSGGGGGTVDLTNYYTKTQTDAAITAAAPNLSGYALKTELPVVPTAVSAFTNDVGYLTQHQSLVNYALKTEIPNVSGFATTGNVETALTTAKDYTDTKIAAIPSPDLSGYALKTELPTVPTKVSAFTNDAGYLTQHQSLESYATKTYVDTEIAAIDIPVAPDLTPYATKTYVDTAVAGVSAPDLTPYALKTEIPDVSGKANSADLATIATSGDYADLANKPTIPSIDGLATETYVNTAISEAALGEEVDLSNYRTISDKTFTIPQRGTDFRIAIDGDVNKCILRAFNNGTLASDTATLMLGNNDMFFRIKQDGTSTNRIDTGINTSMYSNKEGSYYATQSFVTSKGYAVAANLSTVATTGSYNDLLDKPTIPSVEGLVTETYVNNAIAAIPATDLSGYALKTELPTMTNYYTKTEIDATIGDIATLLAAI